MAKKKVAKKATSKKKESTSSKPQSTVSVVPEHVRATSGFFKAREKYKEEQTKLLKERLAR